MKKRVAALGLAAGLAGGSLVGLTLTHPGAVGAQDAGTTTNADGTGRPGGSAHLVEVLRPLVEAGTISQAQADAVIQALEDTRRGRGWHHRAAHMALDAAVTALGMSAEDLREALADGQSLAEVAQARDVDRQVVIDALVAAARSRVAERVTSGHLTQAEADEKLADVVERVTALVDREWSGRPGFGRPGRGLSRLGPDAADGSSPGDSFLTSTPAGAS